MLERRCPRLVKQKRAGTRCHAASLSASSRARRGDQHGDPERSPAPVHQVASDPAGLGPIADWTCASALRAWVSGCRCGPRAVDERAPRVRRVDEQLSAEAIRGGVLVAFDVTHYERLRVGAVGALIEAESPRCSL